ATHPLPDHLHARVPDVDAWRHVPLRDHDEAIAYLEEFIEFFAHDKHRARLIAKLEQLGANLRRRAHVHTPRRLRHDQKTRLRINLPADDELLQVAARQTLGRRIESAGL